MTYHESVYVEKLTLFSAVLREEGITAGPQETADACTILSTMDLADRSTVRDALCAVYAKTREQQLAFYRAFDGFFLSLERREAAKKQQKKEAEELSRLREQAEHIREHRLRRLWKRHLDVRAVMEKSCSPVWCPERSS